MRVILTESIDTLGRAGDVINVADGYGRNFLLPRKKAVIADEKSVKKFAHHKRVLEKKLEKELATAEDLVKRLEGLSVTITKKAGENEKLFGSVTSKEIEAMLSKEGVTIDRKQIVLRDPIKTLGYHHVPVRVGHQLEAQLKIWVVAAEE